MKTSDGRVVSLSDDLVTGHAERLAPGVRQVLEEARLAPSDIQRVGVTVGPGSFMGQRVGIAFAKGFVMGSGAETVALTTLEALAEDAGYPILVVIDARRDQVYVQAFDANRAALGEAELISYDAARQWMGEAERVTGSGVAAVDPGRAALGGETPSSQALLSLTQQRPLSALKTLYLRAPDAKISVRPAL